MKRIQDFLFNRGQAQTFDRATCSAKTPNRFAINKIYVPVQTHHFIKLLLVFLSRASGITYLFIARVAR
jgi:hypothetical protein